MSKLLICRQGNEVSYKRQKEDGRVWLLSDSQIKQVEKFIEDNFFR